ncbi:MAG: 3D domain-containing protein, partial [Oscillospiraceae bacterium]|nr:3D domain-containing protein [Oscillospiraceae bacterium]MBP1556884.1 3D domain-containing protein [Oscillospiraceae bacterium]
SSVVTKEPVTQLVLRGSSDPVSDLDFGVPLDENGVPVTYKKVLTNQICTGYSSWRGAKGASRMVLHDGYVAVRADEIPYGTKMYITSPDNKFVYGFAIAADTGVGLMQNVIDFDLFYETYVESCLNGRKYLNVYIL